MKKIKNIITVAFLASLTLAQPAQAHMGKKLQGGLLSASILTILTIEQNLFGAKYSEPYIGERLNFLGLDLLAEEPDTNVCQIWEENWEEFGVQATEVEFTKGYGSAFESKVTSPLDNSELSFMVQLQDGNKSAIVNVSINNSVRPLETVKLQDGYGIYVFGDNTQRYELVFSLVGDNEETSVEGILLAVTHEDAIAAADALLKELSEVCESDFANANTKFESMKNQTEENYGDENLNNLNSLKQANEAVLAKCLADAQSKADKFESKIDELNAQKVNLCGSDFICLEMLAKEEIPSTEEEVQSETQEESNDQGAQSEKPKASKKPKTTAKKKTSASTNPDKAAQDECGSDVNCKLKKLMKHF